MDYNLETLGDERFQKLSQAILTAAFPNVQCLPVGQPDGGRDAFAHESNGFIVFQVKYSRNPSNKDERIAVSEVIKSEKSKVERLIKRGATSFYLLTNVSGTSHLDVGSIDQVNEELSRAFGIPSFCWWRDDIERRIDATEGLIWRYPDIFRGTDFLEILTSGKIGSINGTKSNTFRAYVSAQYQKESEVRFQQVQIQNSLLDLFTDTPIGLAREKSPSPDVCHVPERTLSYLAATIHHQRLGYPYDGGSEILAADWLLKIAPKSGIQRLILEGAPGQGKSTVTQYIAQLQRMRTLRKQHDTSKVSESHLSHVVRLPLRVDLRDYATWLIGNDPFAAEKDVRRPLKSIDSLESFLSYQIYTLSGGREFTVDDLMLTLANSHAMIILDGFDEVADKTTRVKLIDQIRTASERLGTDCASLQIIVTSRPAAFILSPGFPEREWLHMSLLPMRMGQIGEYTDKWIAARNLNPTDSRDFKVLLLDRVSRSHIRSLAQNPMQLAILLSLISAKGRSLPDKRTALYDSYMDLFFGREAEKDETVRENRDVLIQIHQYVAWKLQLDAESPGGSGSISQSELELLVKNFLIEKQHDGDVLKLFTGAVERVGALVSRVQGMLEFEVQPLREYFTGRFLYETAPYSPAGNEKGGTRPQRFYALARRPYWLNVARFYAGCYNSGELSSLVSALIHLSEKANLAVSSHIVQLALLFVNDWVFSQEPRTVKEVINFITTETNLRILASSRTSFEDERLSLPEKSGRAELVSKVTDAYLTVSDHAYKAKLGLILRLNADATDRWNIWRQIREKGNDGQIDAKDLGLFIDADISEHDELIAAYGVNSLTALVNFGKWDYLSAEQRHAAITAHARHPVRSWDAIRDGRVVHEDYDLFKIYAMLNPHIYLYVSYDAYSELPFEEFLNRYGLFRGRIGTSDAPDISEGEFHDVVTSSNRACRFSVSQWRTSLEPWSDLVESFRRTWGDTDRVFAIAAIGAGIRSKDSRSVGYSNVLDQSLPLVERARYARLKPSANWWKLALANADGDRQLFWVLTLALAWATGGVMRAIAKDVGLHLDKMKSSDWFDLANTVRAIVAVTGDVRQPMSGFDDNTVKGISSQRLKAILALRLPKNLSGKALQALIGDFDGEDRNLGKFVAGQVLSEAHRDNKLWKSLLIATNSYRDIFDVPDINTPLHLERYVYAPNETMPMSVVNEISDQRDSVSFKLLEIAELNSSRRAENSHESLGKVAEEEEWFNE